MSETCDKLTLLCEEQESVQDDQSVQVLPPPEPVQPQDGVENRAQPQVVAYSLRWYILVMFGLLACHSCVVWNTWGPIETSVQFAYNWSNSTAPMMANWGTIMFCLSVVPLSKLVEVK